MPYPFKKQKNFLTSSQIFNIKGPGTDSKGKVIFFLAIQIASKVALDDNIEMIKELNFKMKIILNFLLIILIIFNGCGYEMPPLIRAAEEGNAEKVELLIKKGAKADKRYRRGDTALATAVRFSHLKVVKILLDNEAEVDRRVGAGWTPLMMAAFTGHYEIAKLLTEYGADVNAYNELGDTPVIHCLYPPNTNPNLLKLLLNNGAKVNYDNGASPPLYLACHTGADLAVIKMLVEHGANIEGKVDGETPLSAAIGRGDKEITDYLKKELKERLSSGG